MSLLFLFLLGIGNFAAQGAAWDSGHPVLQSLLERYPMVQWFTLAVEFAMLTTVMLMSADGWATASWVYAFYTAGNLASAWLFQSGRI